MQPRELKNYDKYLQKIELYAQAMEITLERKPEPSDGAYVPSRRVIRVDPDLSQSTEIAVLLHELGHATDFYNLTVERSNAIDTAYTCFYKKNPSKKQKKLVYACEQRAWAHGRVIAEKLRIPLGKWYKFEEESGIKSYKEA